MKAENTHAIAQWSLGKSAPAQAFASNVYPLMRSAALVAQRALGRVVSITNAWAGLITHQSSLKTIPKYVAQRVKVDSA
jgi:hypothetical protein